MKHTIAVRIELGTLSNSPSNETCLESMYNELREFCANLDNEYGGAGYVKINIAHENGKAIRKAKEN